MGGPQKATTCLSDKGEIEQVKRVRMRKVRVICTDPDATESSSDERDEGEQRGSSQKRVVREILIPALVPSREAAEESCYSASIHDRQFAHTAPPSSSPAPPKRNSNKISSKRRSLKKWRQVSSMSSRTRDTLLETGKKACRYKGVRQRRWGKWTAELRESSQGVRMWLGTFDSAKEAAIAYDEAAINLKGSEALTNFGSSSPGSSLSSPDIHLGLSGNHRNDCSPTVDICADNIELPLSCAELKAMEDCLLACSPSSVLDQPNSSDCGLLVSSPSSVLESMFTDDCASAPFQAFDAGMACGKRAEECYSSRHASVRHAGDYMGEHQMGLAMPRDQMEYNLKHEPAALEEPFFEVFGNLYDNEGSNFASQDGPACHEFVPFEDLPDDEGASLTSFELDAEALTWINLQP